MVVADGEEKMNKLEGKVAVITGAGGGIGGAIAGSLAAEKMKLVRGANGDYELEVPLSVIGFAPAAGTTVKGDIGVLRGSGGETIARLYWSNKATGIVADVPSEAELKPQNWGILEIKQ